MAGVVGCEMRWLFFAKRFGPMFSGELQASLRLDGPRSKCVRGEI